MAPSTLEKVAAKDQVASVRRSARTLAWPVAVFVLLTLFLVGDIAADYVDGVGTVHMAMEVGAVMFALLGVVVTGRQLGRALRRSGELQRDLHGTRVQLERSRCETEALVRRLGRAIEVHFDSWVLTGAEREIGLLILRGLSYKEIANERGTTERTVRHQALAIYRKAGVAGRAEMAAFFLRDMLHRVSRSAAQEAPADAAAHEPEAPAASEPEASPTPAPLGSPLKLLSGQRGS